MPRCSSSSQRSAGATSGAGPFLTANHEHELSVHVRGALNNGVSRPELQEILLQAGLYAGAPAALAAFRIAKQTLQAIDNDAGRSDQGDAAQEGR